MASIAPFSDSMSPNNNNSTQGDELRVSEDPKFALHVTISVSVSGAPSVSAQTWLIRAKFAKEVARCSVQSSS
ncbi:hypothetical protein CUMW_000420 [Citrus unshiu]|nr:hypothetical protein CUMW_000420 [Citrus unshiu]